MKTITVCVGRIFREDETDRCPDCVDYVPLAEYERLRRALEDCIDSLEYVDRAHPSTTGYGVREQRISNARKALEG